MDKRLLLFRHDPDVPDSLTTRKSAFLYLHCRVCLASILEQLEFPVVGWAKLMQATLAPFLAR